MEVQNTEIHVEPTEVEDGVEPTSALGSQEVMRIESPTPWSSDTWTVTTAPLMRRDTTSSHSASLQLQAWQLNFDRYR